MTRLTEQLIFRIQNIIEIVPKEIQMFNLNMLIAGALWFFAFYFISRWTKSYIIRLILLILGISVLWEVTAKSHILTNVDFYLGLGLLLPQIEIIEASYLMLREKTIATYESIISFLQLLISPFVWLYARFKYLNEYFKAKQETRQEQNNYSQEFRQRQYDEYKKEQAQRDEKERQEQKRQQREYQEQKRQEQEKARQEYQKQQAKQQQTNKHPRWDSSDPYEVLDIPRTTSKDEIKKKYRALCNLYHPDKTQDPDKKIKNKKIMQNINAAYEKLG